MNVLNRVTQTVQIAYCGKCRQVLSLTDCDGAESDKCNKL